MEWYYAEGGRRVGPVDSFEFESLVETGVITPETHVWNETLTKWTPYGKLVQGDAPSQAPPNPESSGINFSQEYASCGECGKRLPQDEMIRFQNTWVCGNCKLHFIQKLKEGGRVSNEVTYAGFWIRFAAKFIDNIISGLIGGVLGGALGFALFSVIDNESDVGLFFQVIFQLMGILIGGVYSTFFVGKYGATPGKMMLHLKVVRPDGEKVGYPRALGRYFAEWLSGMILAIGYIMAAFDEEKRSLHDRICDTRVILTKR
ncbi:MAG: RDD family protein [bacterium]|nr:RDD family protein [bacterium]